MALCPRCNQRITPVSDPAATPAGGGFGITAMTWVCPICDVILGVTEVDLLSTARQRYGNVLAP